MKQKILYLLLPALLLAACDSDDMGGPSPAAQDGEQIRFEISFAGNDTPTLRAATAPDFTTTWETGDQVGLFIVKGAGGLQASGNYADNLPMTRQSDGSWSYTLPAGKEYYPEDGDALHFYAYYPYDATLADPTAYTFTVKADQSGTTDGKSNYNLSDLLLAKVENVTKSSNPVSLQFSHALSLVQVEVKREVNVPRFSDADFTVTLTGALPDATLGWGSDLTGTGTATDIVMHKVDGLDYTYRALVPAQTLSADSKVTFVQATAGKEIDMSYPAIASVTLTAAKAHQHNVTLGWSIDPDHEYKVGDRYPHVGPTIGIVFYIENNGKNGKAVSLTENSGVKWADAYDNTDAKDLDNGRINMHTIYNRANDFSGYPAFAWVHRLNPPGTDYSDESATGVWYLPAVEELSDLKGRNLVTVNAALINAEGAALSGIYWSSTEYYSDRVYVEAMDTIDKTKLYNARAIIAF